MSEYFKQLEVLKARRCDKCHGTGECDDAEPGDMSFNTWPCPDCGGTGMTPRTTGSKQS